jgi:hypothetical protein
LVFFKKEQDFFFKKEAKTFAYFMPSSAFAPGLVASTHAAYGRGAWVGDFAAFANRSIPAPCWIP